jgi:hypothetical protein
MIKNIQLVIEKDVPRPKKGSGPPIRYPFAEMKLNESIFVPSGFASANNAQSAAGQFMKRHKEFKFTCRKVDGGVRVWRIEVNKS